MRRARCKFTVESVSPPYEGATSNNVTLQTLYDPELSKEDESFSKYTPSGQMQFIVDNPALEGFFTPGRQFYVDLTPVE